MTADKTLEIARTVPITLAGLAAQLAVHANMEDADRGAARGWHEEQIVVSAGDAALRLTFGEPVA